MEVYELAGRKLILIQGETPGQCKGCAFNQIEAGPFGDTTLNREYGKALRPSVQRVESCPLPNWYPGHGTLRRSVDSGDRKLGQRTPIKEPCFDNTVEDPVFRIFVEDTPENRALHVMRRMEKSGHFDEGSVK